MDDKNGKFKKALAGVLRDRRRIAGLSQTQLAEKSGYSLPLIWAYENEKYTPKVDTLYAICGQLGITMKSFLAMVEKRMKEIK